MSDKSPVTKQPVILAVDDNLQNLQVIGNVINDNISCDLRIAKSGTEALELIEKFIPDLILLDVNMPQMDGFTVCQKIKSIEMVKDVPIIFITARGDNDSIIRGFEVGGADYIVKPFDPMELTARVRTHLELRLSRLELMRINRDLKERNEKMENDLRIAQTVMKSLISMKKPECEGIDIEFRYIPLDKVGGDYFKVFPMSQRQCGIFLGDVTGHGVAAALFLSLIKSVTDHIQAENGTMPAQFLHMLNLELKGKMTSYFISCLYLYIIPEEPGKFQLILANGGHPKPILIRNGNASFIGEINPVVGIMSNITFQQKTLPLYSGDRIFLYTDGIPETRNDKNEIIGFKENLLNLFMHSNTPHLSNTLDGILNELANFRDGMDVDDDITIIGLDIL
ncbi:MAG: fused response regulator/phosphatase [Spirochaetes bacterium]|nr:fused response regulator/phosphatase [Spirochaetota bacterium]